MINKQPLAKSALVFTLLALLVPAGAKAQVTEKSKIDSGRTAKVKIMEKEGDQYLMLDTTLTLAPGMTLREAVNNLKARGATLRSLGAKEIEPTTIENTKIFRTHPGKLSDSLRARVFRQQDGRAVLAEHISIAMADTSFKNLRPTRILLRDFADLDSLQVRREFTTAFKMLRPSTAKTFIIDSTLKGRVVYVRDSAFLQNMDIKDIEHIRVLKGDGPHERRIISLGKDGQTSVLELGDYQVTQIPSGDAHQIIVLRTTKESKAKGKKGMKNKPAEPNKLEVMVYPNPTSGSVKLSFTVPKRSDTKVRIVNSQGKTVFEDTRNQFQGEYTKEINLARFGAGVYVIQLQSGNLVQSEKVLVQ